MLPARISALIPIPCRQQNREAPTPPLQSFRTFQGGQPSQVMGPSVSLPPPLGVREHDSLPSGHQAKTGELCQSEYTRNPEKVLSVLMLA